MADEYKIARLNALVGVAAVFYKDGYDNIKKLCLEGEIISLEDISVLAKHSVLMAEQLVDFIEQEEYK